MPEEKYNQKRNEKRPAHSLARVLSLRMALMLLCGLIVLYLGAFHAVDSAVRMDNERYLKTIAGIYADDVAYEAAKKGVPVDANFSENITVYGDYVCRWDPIDVADMYVPDVEKGTIRYLSISYKREDYSDLAEIYDVTGIADEEIEYELRPEELAVWRGEVESAVIYRSDRVPVVETVYGFNDSFGNRILAGMAVSMEGIKAEISERFISLALVILAVFAALIVLMYWGIVRRVSRPAKRICRGMADFIADGHRTGVRLDEKGQDEFSMIAQSFNHMSDELDSYLKNIRALNRDRERQRTELEIASAIQQGFLQPARFDAENCDINAAMIPARDVGGDLYDYLPLGGGRTMVVVADVSGKGMAAALFMAVTLVLMRMYAREGLEPAEILRRTNDALSDRNPGMMFATAVVGIYDGATGVLSYANAGHNPPFIVGRDVRVLDGAHNALLGLYEDEEYVQESVRLETGDRLLLYTDGVTEATDGEKRFFGEARLNETLLAARGREAVPTVLDAVRAFAGDAEQHDDITILALTTKRATHLELQADMREFARVRALLMDAPIGRRLKLDLCVAAEELFCNICTYAFEGRDAAAERISFDFELSDRVLMRFTDGGIPFDPREDMNDPDDYDIDTQIGGLGRIIAFGIADSVDYAYRDGHNILTIMKYIQTADDDPSPDKRNSGGTI